MDSPTVACDWAPAPAQLAGTASASSPSATTAARQAKAVISARKRAERGPGRWARPWLAWAEAPAYPAEPAARARGRSSPRRGDGVLQGGRIGGRLVAG